MFKKFLLDWVWQLPQNLLGLAYKAIIKNDIIVEVNEGNPYRVFLKKSNGGVTLGKYIFLYHNYRNLEFDIAHETGHYKQSKMLGPLYLIIIGIPSILWAALNDYIAPNKSYYWFYTEKWANKLAGIS